MTDIDDITITAEIPLDASLDRRTIVSYGDDGDPIYSTESTTVAEAVIAAAAAILQSALLQEFSSQGYYSGGVSRLYEDKLRGHVEAIIDARVDEQLQAVLAGSPTSPWDEGRPAISLAEYIDKKVTEWLSSAAKRDSYGRGAASRLDEAVEKVIDRELTKAIDAAMADARKRALDAITKVAQDQMADALRQSIASLGK